MAQINEIRTWIGIAHIGNMIWGGLLSSGQSTLPLITNSKIGCGVLSYLQSKFLWNIDTGESRFKKLRFKKESWFKKDCPYNQNFST